MINSLQQSYEVLAQSMIDLVQSRPWTKAVCECQIYDGMTSYTGWIENNGVVDDQSLDWMDIYRSYDAADAANFLKTYLLEKTGSRIWGLTFTLYPTGKFNIDYDYNKPEDYEEGDEQITGAQANESLFKLGFRGESESNE
jgi:hypothetical protein